LQDLESSNLNLKSQINEKEQNVNLLKHKFDKTKKELNDKILVVNDLKDSVTLKITVADDLQSLLQ
jgi:hypothetical protein